MRDGAGRREGRCTEPHVRDACWHGGRLRAEQGRRARGRRRTRGPGACGRRRGGRIGARGGCGGLGLRRDVLLHPGERAPCLAVVAVVVLGHVAPPAGAGRRRAVLVRGGARGHLVVRGGRDARRPGAPLDVRLLEALGEQVRGLGRRSGRGPEEGQVGEGGPSGRVVVGSLGRHVSIVDVASTSAAPPPDALLLSTHRGQRRHSL
mmetsp:Transcript_71744/g.154919  ORF Transcript_71744/g.154919 Transcript_71744/m.154919 type:complete len:206 (+) Transcript_71744:511-1128(+)